MHHNTITRMRRSSYRRRPLRSLLKDIGLVILWTGMVLFLGSLLYAILITLGGWER